MKTRKPQRLAWLLVATVLLPLHASAAQPDANEPWVTVSSENLPRARHEAGGVAIDGKLYVLGGRGNRPVEVYNPNTRRWQSLGAAPAELHHFQPVAIGKKIYIVGAMTCCYPTEPSVADIHVFDTQNNTWSVAGQIPSDRQRGGAGAVVYQGKIYLLGGNTLGHNGGAVEWFDEYDPATGNWRTLADAPRARDHFQAALIGRKLVATGGRRTAQPNPFANGVAPTDIYNFDTNQWSSRKSIPTLRAGAVTIAHGSEVLIAGGEISTTAGALNVVEAYDVGANTWRTLQPLQRGRHSGGGGVVGSTWHLVAGSGGKGGSPELTSHETLELDGQADADADTDNDGLTDNDEINIHGTDPEKADTDGDTLNDKREVDIGSNPTKVDTDDDGLNDADEVNLHQTNPTRKDTDGDTIDDRVELEQIGSNPRRKDTDNDGLDDNRELAANTNPLVADTDSDGLGDGAEIDRGTDPLAPDSDNDGLMDGAEVLFHDTNPLKRDSDDDSLDDASELMVFNTDPLLADTDVDGLDDGVEVGEYKSDPNLADTDFDGLTDGEEILQYQTNPLVADSDQDGLDDGDEVLTFMTDPTLVDTDGDGESDYVEFFGPAPEPDGVDSDNPPAPNEGDMPTDGESEGGNPSVPDEVDRPTQGGSGGGVDDQSNENDSVSSGGGAFGGWLASVLLGVLAARRRHKTRISRQESAKKRSGL